MSTPKKLHMIGNAHLDPVWLWRWQEGFQEIKATFRSALDRLEEYEDFIFTSSSAAYYEWIEHNNPRMLEEIKARVREGRWVLCGGWWVQPDCNLPSGESFVRQGLYGQRYFRQTFGMTATIGYNVDSFGHHGMLPQILRKSGMSHYVFMRPMAHEKEMDQSLFWWESPDGSRVLTYRVPFGYNTNTDQYSELQQRVSEAEALLGQEQAAAGMAFYGVGNHGGGPTKRNIEHVRELAAASDDMAIAFSSPLRFFEEAMASGTAYPVHRDDLQKHASGCYSVHSGVKKWNRQAEHLLVNAEAWGAIAAWTTGATYAREDMHRAWKATLFNQFHDILAGTSIQEAYEDAQDLYGETKAIAARAMNHGMQALSWDIAIPPEEGMLPIVVWNSHPWEVTQAVELEVSFPGWVALSSCKGNELLLDDEGQEVAWQLLQSQATADFRTRIVFVAAVPATGYRVYRLYRRPEEDAPREYGPAVAVSEYVLENAKLRLELDPATGTIKSLRDKQGGGEVLRAGGGRALVLQDLSDTWSHDTVRFDDIVGEFQAVRIRLVEQGPVKAVIRVESEYRRSTLVQEYHLHAQSDAVEVRAELDWQEPRAMLKLHFPLAGHAERGTYEIPYGHIKRPLNGEEEPGLQWTDLSGTAQGRRIGLSLLNDCKYSFDMRDNAMNMTVTRSPIYAHHVPASLSTERAYAHIDIGIQTFRYALLPHQGDWRQAGTVRRAIELNHPAMTLLETYHEGPLPQRASFVSIDHPAVIASAIKLAEDDDALIVRCIETAGTAARATIRFPYWDRAFTADFTACELKTFRIPRDAQEPIREVDLLEMGLAEER